MFSIGSHDTMTYLRPAKWWMRIFHFMAQCQDYSIQKQYEDYGVKMFDIRLKYLPKEDKWVFAHGSIYFDKDIYEVFDYLNSRGESIYVRMLLEYNRKPKNEEAIISKYITLCRSLRKTSKNLKFFEFRMKYNWEPLFKYKGMITPNICQRVSSTTGKIIDDWFPRLYAWMFNKDIVNQGTNADWLLIDFIGKYYK